MRAWLALTLLGLAAPRDADAATPFRSVAIFPAENKHNHASCVIELANGDLLAAWYNGTGERTADDVLIQGAWLKSGEAAWGPRFTMADTPGYPDCNPALFAAPDRTIWLFWPTILDHRWEGALLKFAVAPRRGPPRPAPRAGRRRASSTSPRRASAPRWTGRSRSLPEPAREAAKPSSTASRRARRTSSISASAGCRASIRRSSPRAAGSCRSTPTRSTPRSSRSPTTGARPGRPSEPMIGFGNIQPSLVRKDDGTIVAFMRDNGTHRKIRLSTSTRRRPVVVPGRPTRPSPTPAPGSRRSGWPTATGPSSTTTRPRAATRWPCRSPTTRGRPGNGPGTSSDVGEGQGQFHYPSILQARDGTIHVTYTRRLAKEGSTIQHAAFDEAWVTAGP